MSASKWVATPHDLDEVRVESMSDEAWRQRDSPTRLSYWFPLVEAAGLPVPRTFLVPNDPDDLYQLMDGKEPRCLSSLVANIVTAAAHVGAPFFLRTDFTSGKHGWKDTCFVESSDSDVVRKHVAAIWEFSELADILGLPTDMWVVREMLHTSPRFYAFRGDMPITREVRIFVRDGIIEHEQMYWPSAAFDGQNVSTLNWPELLRLMRITAKEKQDVLQLREMTLKVSAAVPGFWSVDWLQTTDRGWVLIDMAEGDKSYRWAADASKQEAPA